MLVPHQGVPVHQEDEAGGGEGSQVLAGHVVGYLQRNKKEKKLIPANLAPGEAADRGESESEGGVEVAARHAARHEAAQPRPQPPAHAAGGETAPGLQREDRLGGGPAPHQNQQERACLQQ